MARVAGLVIAVRDLEKRYGSNVAVAGLSFDIAKGEVVGFLGPNGAGKTTTLRILTGALGMTRGTVRVLGHDIVEEAAEAKRAIGYMPEAVPLYPELRVVEYLRFRAELKGVRRALRRAAVDEAMEKARVTDVAGALIGSLSKGYRQRVGLADALVAKAPILVLDEPTAGLDPNQVREVRAVLRGLGSEHTVLLSTHILSEVETSCTRALLLSRGKLVADGTIDELLRLARAGTFVIEGRGDRAVVERALADAGLSGATVDATADGGFRATCAWPLESRDDDRAERSEQAISALVHARVAVRCARTEGGSLEDVFASLTKDEEPRDEAQS